MKLPQTVRASIIFFLQDADLHTNLTSYSYHSGSVSSSYAGHNSRRPVGVLDVGHISTREPGVPASFLTPHDNKVEHDLTHRLCAVIEPNPVGFKTLTRALCMQGPQFETPQHGTLESNCLQPIYGFDLDPVEGDRPRRTGQEIWRSRRRRRRLNERRGLLVHGNLQRVSDCGRGRRWRG